MLITIGRAPDNNIVYSSPTVSAHHAQLSTDRNGNVIIHDFSTNGTMVNGSIIHHSSYFLHGGDSVVLPGSNKLDWEVLIYGKTGNGAMSNNIGNTYCYGDPVSNESFYQQNPSPSFAPPPAYNPPSGSPHPNSGYYRSSQHDMGFFEAVRTAFSNYAVFQGRARRKEFWYFYLFSVLCNCLLLCIPSPGNLIASSLFGLMLFLPGLGLAVRRLHDTNHSGLSLFFVLIPLVGPILLIVWYCTEGTQGTNKYGPSPK